MFTPKTLKAVIFNSILYNIILFYIVTYATYNVTSEMFKTKCMYVCTVWCCKLQKLYRLFDCTVGIGFG
jgi:hypothetical protein